MLIPNVARLMEFRITGETRASLCGGGGFYIGLGEVGRLNPIREASLHELGSQTEEKGDSESSTNIHLSLLPEFRNSMTQMPQAPISTPSPK